MNLAAPITRTRKLVNPRLSQALVIRITPSQIQFRAIGVQSRYSVAKEVGIFCPYGAGNRDGVGENVPVIGGRRQSAWPV